MESRESMRNEINKLININNEKDNILYKIQSIIFDNQQIIWRNEKLQNNENLLKCINQIKEIDVSNNQTSRDIHAYVVKSIIEPHEKNIEQASYTGSINDIYNNVTKLRDSIKDNTISLIKLRSNVNTISYLDEKKNQRDTLNYQENLATIKGQNTYLQNNKTQSFCERIASCFGSQNRKNQAGPNSR